VKVIGDFINKPLNMFFSKTLLNAPQQKATLVAVKLFK